MKNIVLIGFMGTGKSSCGKTLAKQLGFCFVDLDREIEKECQMTIPEMFQLHGESFFRDKEKAMVKNYANRRNIILATGGGTVKDPDNVQILKTTGKIICLTATPEVIEQRTRRLGRRPVLDARAEALGGDRLQAVKELMEARAYMYQQADFQVDTGSLTPLQVAQKISAYMRKYSS